jgi:hypothetical protein
MAMREWLDSTGGKIAAGLFLLVAAVGVFLGVRNFFGPRSEVAAANQRWFIDASTGKRFSHDLKAGETFPVRAPSGQNAGYPAELCYWTKDGRPKDDPTPVLMKMWKGEEGPTFCPDCGRLVRPHNPKPKPGDKPPPTEAEYKQRRGSPNQQDER